MNQSDHDKVNESWSSPEASKAIACGIAAVQQCGWPLGRVSHLVAPQSSAAKYTKWSRTRPSRVDTNGSQSYYSKSFVYNSWDHDDQSHGCVEADLVKLHVYSVPRHTREWQCVDLPLVSCPGQDPYMRASTFILWLLSPLSMFAVQFDHCSLTLHPIFGLRSRSSLSRRLGISDVRLYKAKRQGI